MPGRHLELCGINEVNKGAELMLHAVADQTRSHLRGWTVSVAQDAASFEARARAGVHQRVRFDRFGSLGLAAGDLIPSRVRGPLGLVAERQIDAVLDASGFAYSDQQRLEPFADRVRDYTRWRRQGKTIVLLPQAFGPFDAPRTRELGAALLAQVQLAFARDEVSRQALLDLGVDTPVELAPDFTCLLQVEASSDQRGRFGGRTCVVPNFRMVDRMPPDRAAAYQRVLVELLTELEQRGARPFVLIVNAKKDAELIRSLAGALPRPPEIVAPDDPLDVKRLLGVADLVVASRYHGLVSSLLQGVPALALGWSHKYPALMADHGVPDLLFEVEDRDGLLDAVTTLGDPDVRAERAADLDRRAADLRARTEAMWRRVAATLDA